MMEISELDRLITVYKGNEVFASALIRQLKKHVTDDEMVEEVIKAGIDEAFEKMKEV